MSDEPAPLATWLPEYARAVGAQAPFKVPGFLTRPATGSYGVYLLQEQPGAANAKARRELSWAPSVPSWRRGFQEHLTH